MANSYIEKIEGIDFIIADIDSSKCLTQNAMYNEFSEAFDFPSSPNQGSLDVLLDYMRDLGWHKVKNYKVILKNREKAKKKNLTEYNEVIHLLDFIKESWDQKKQIKNCEFENNFLIDFK